ncbi:PQQ repeat protein [Haladaptatus paucihalophilus DX253]|uniref:Outer membrane protein assembly factor BamB, contains PQQ-like beta-propeller repeat n=1 Tax=Haladaptatus paucihalophilus DX253 TaxID=797209 RepID=E7QXF5_HALPU|nr:PQQ-binding-like beta-propeller repeat protein [Haladaptatus paucihalophilus]EFW90958.1 PQQ repeat protein [Haladaptatus paucihalophilus DX253]SHK27442.1 Outer membrane protein assembly factor BamB, contains PQQ-like beta-propeller repeat [Haladaptatus paucihalophilus DX253]
MKRRAFLAAGGLALGAGCSDLLADSKKTEQSPPPEECAIDPSVTPGTSDWTSKRGGPKNTGSVPSDDVPAPPLRIDWTYTMGGHTGVSPPVVAHETVYTTNLDREVHAVDAKTGEHRWQANVSVSSAAAVAGGRVFVADDGSVTALDAMSGEQRWRTDSDVGAHLLSGGVQATERTVFVSGDIFLSAFDAETGERRWRFSTGLETKCRPAIANGTVYVGSDDTSVYALDAETGERRWRYKTDGRINCDPAVADGGVYAASDDGNLYVLDAEMGEKRWRKEVGTVGHLAVDGGHVYVGFGGQYGPTMDAFTAASGTACWSSEEYVSGYASGIAASSEYLYLPVGSLSGSYSVTLGALDPKTGETAWRFPNSNARFDNGPAVVDGAVYAAGMGTDGLTVARFVPKD